jgi:hypothetical protein
MKGAIILGLCLLVTLAQGSAISKKNEAQVNSFFV